MSIKIHSGYIIENPNINNQMTVKQLLDFCIEFQSNVKPLAMKRAAKIIMREMINYIDSKTFGIHTEDSPMKSPYFRACEIINEHSKKIIYTHVRDPFYDFLCDIVFYSVDDKVLCILDTEIDEYTKVFEQMHGVREFGYWNNTDRPDEISEEEWDYRADLWRRASKDSYEEGRFSYHVVTSDNIGIYCSQTFEQALQLIPNIEARINPIYMSVAGREFGIRYPDSQWSINKYLKWLDSIPKIAKKRFEEYVAERLVKVDKDLLLNDYDPIVQDDINSYFKHLLEE